MHVGRSFALGVQDQRVRQVRHVQRAGLFGESPQLREKVTNEICPWLGRLHSVGLWFQNCFHALMKPQFHSNAYTPIAIPCALFAYGLPGTAVLFRSW